MVGNIGRLDQDCSTQYIKKIVLDLKDGKGVVSTRWLGSTGEASLEEFDQVCLTQLF